MSAVAKSPDICSLIMCEPGSAETFDPRAGCWAFANTAHRQKSVSPTTGCTVLHWHCPGTQAATCCPWRQPPAPGLIKQPELISSNYAPEARLSSPAAPKAPCHGSKMNHEKVRGEKKQRQVNTPRSSEGEGRAVPQGSPELDSDGNSRPPWLSCRHPEQPGQGPS